jgi:prolipoprotein diacylglyceryltransferase
MSFIVVYSFLRFILIEPIRDYPSTFIHISQLTVLLIIFLASSFIFAYKYLYKDLKNID